MIIYRLEDNTVRAEFDWSQRFTCPEAQWKVDIQRFLEKKTALSIHVIAPVVSAVINRKTVFYGKAKFDDITTLEQAKEYAKQNLINNFERTLSICVIELHKYISNAEEILFEALFDLDCLNRAY